MNKPFGAIGRSLLALLVVVALQLAAPRTAAAITLNLHADPNPSTTGTYTITWDNFGDGTYRLQERVGSTGMWYSIHFTASGWSFTVTDKPAGEYHYRIVWSFMECDRFNRFRRDACEFIDRNSETLVVTVENPKPAVPQNFSTDPAPEEIGGPLLVQTNHDYTIYWSTVAGAASYELQERLDAIDGFPSAPDVGVWKVAYSGSLTSVAFYPKKIESSWSYRVRACDANGVCGDWSATLQVIVFLFRPPPEPPPPEPGDEDEIESSWNGFVTALDSGDVAGAMQFISPTVHSRYEPALVALGENVRDLTAGWSGIKAISIDSDFAEFTVFVTRNGQTRLHIVTFQLQDGVWRLLEF